MVTQQRSGDVWERILALLDEKLQYGLLEQAKAVTEVSLEGEELALTVSTREAFEFFSAHINQQRLIILSRQEISLEKVSVSLKEIEK